MIKVLVTCDEDDFVVVPLYLREHVLETLKTCLSGDLWANRDDKEKYPDDLDINSLSETEYDEFIDDLTSCQMYCQVVVMQE